jgi:hypothetical protein
MATLFPHLEIMLPFLFDGVLRNIHFTGAGMAGIKIAYGNSK